MKLTANPRSLLALCVAQLAIVLFAAMAEAQLIVPLPGVEGTYDSHTFVGNVVVPETQGTSDACLAIAGTMTSGQASSTCPPPVGPYRIGPIFHFLMYLDGAVPWVDTSVGYFGPDGAFSVEIPLVTATAPFVPLESLGGSFVFELHVNTDAFGSPWCVTVERLPVVTIESAAIVSLSGVATEGTTWGAIKGLFR